MGWGAGDLKYRFQWTFPVVLSPFNSSVLYVGANVVFKSTDEGQSWQAISSDLTRNDKTKQGPSGGPITKDNTTSSTTTPSSSLRRVPRTQGYLGGKRRRLVHVTRDGGKTWANVTLQRARCPTGR